MVVAFRDGLRSDTKKTLFRRVELRARDLLTNIELIVNIIIPGRAVVGGKLYDDHFRTHVIISTLAINNICIRGVKHVRKFGVNTIWKF